jgi:hypothetical protein
MATNFPLLAATGLQPTQEEYRPADRWLRRLCVALLADALKDLGGFGSCGGRVARARYGREAGDWVRSDAWYFFSFSLVCTVLDLDIEAARSHIIHRFAPGSAPRTGQAHLPRSPWRGSTADVPAPPGRPSGKYCGRVLR